MLAAIERETQGEPFLIIGIHSPKFSAQRGAALVADAVRRLEVSHPVVLDEDSRITRSFAVTGWPTMIVVDPNGYLLATARGEPEPQALLGAIRQMLDQGRRDGSLATRPPPLRPPLPHQHRLSFPGAVVLAPEPVVADPGHHQVSVLDSLGAERLRIGSGTPGYHDGDHSRAQLRRPCGLAWAPELEGGTLFIADTGNHAVRAVSLATGMVRTVAGGAASPAVGARDGLRSPWGLAWDGQRLFIAGAGQHQIWRWDAVSGQAGPFAGTGVEGGRDGAAGQAWFAQPSGLALVDGVLYVADAESSSIRAITGLRDQPVVSTLCGSGDLFGFGDRDGTGRTAELQHPIGLAAGAGLLFVADTFNHKIRTVDPRTGACRTLFGGGGAEIDTESPSGTILVPARPGVPAFSAPEGLAWREGELVVADTGNHRIVALSLAGGARRVLLGG